MKSVYIVSKPLQYVNATNINDPNSSRDLLIINKFKDAKKFKIFLTQHSNLWSNILYFNSVYSAFLYIIIYQRKYNNLFIDSDYGIILQFYLSLLFNLKIYTYEEGYGSYIPVISDKNTFSKLKHKLHILLGGQYQIGGSRFTSGVILYYPEAYKIQFPKYSKNILSFKKPFLSHLKTLNDINKYFSSIKFDIFENQDVLVYLDSNVLNKNYLDILTKHPTYFKVFKPHPYKKKDEVLRPEFDLVFDLPIPAELMISEILNRCNKLVIIHGGSTAMISFINNPRIVEYNFSPLDLDYDNYTNFIKTISRIKND